MTTEILDTEALADYIKETVMNDPAGVITAEQALSSDLVNVRLFDEPLIEFAAADDPLFEHLKNPDVIGPEIMMPEEWLPGAQTIVSIFFPFSDVVRESNYDTPEDISNAWLHGRIEGQQFMMNVIRKTIEYITEAGGQALAPMMDSRFAVFGETVPNEVGQYFQSTWSERHAAFIAGLGTFGLTRSLITRRGTAGRYGSIITSLKADCIKERPYKDVYEWCTRCGSCIPRCPVSAISLEEGKNQKVCHAFQEETKVRYAPRYGCGKCQTQTPCEKTAPGLK